MGESRISTQVNGIGGSSHLIIDHHHHLLFLSNFVRTAGGAAYHYIPSIFFNHTFPFLSPYYSNKFMLCYQNIGAYNTYTRTRI